jgi:hypothetical protein
VGAPARARQQTNPSGVVFNALVPLRYLWPVLMHAARSASPATVHITVSAVQSASNNGGGGGCALRPRGQAHLTTLVEALGNILLPVLVLAIIRLITPEETTTIRIIDKGLCVSRIPWEDA